MHVNRITPIFSSIQSFILLETIDSKDEGHIMKKCDTKAHEWEARVFVNGVYAIWELVVPLKSLQTKVVLE